MGTIGLWLKRFLLTLLVTLTIYNSGFVVLPKSSLALDLSPSTITENIKNVKVSDLENLVHQEFVEALKNGAASFDLQQINIKTPDLGNLIHQDFVEALKSEAASFDPQRVKQIISSASEQFKELIPKDLAPSAYNQIIKLISSETLILSARNVVSMSPGMFCQAYYDSISGVDNSTWNTIQGAAESLYFLVNSIYSASLKGAGALSNYAGLAHVVSELGLGKVVTVIAGLMGEDLTGAAATSFVVSTLGGPVVVGILLVGGAGLATYGTYELGKFASGKFTNWAGTYCSTSYSHNT